MFKTNKARLGKTFLVGKGKTKAKSKRVEKKEKKSHVKQYDETKKKAKEELQKAFETHTLSFLVLESFLEIDRISFSLSLAHSLTQSLVYSKKRKKGGIFERKERRKGEAGNFT